MYELPAPPSHVIDEVTSGYFWPSVDSKRVSECAVRAFVFLGAEAVRKYFAQSY